MEVSPGSSTGGNDGFDRNGSLAEEELEAFNVPEVAVDEERKLREEREAREREVAGKKGGAAEGEKEDGVLNEGKYEQVRVLRVGRREARYGLWVVGCGLWVVGCGLWVRGWERRRKSCGMNELRRNFPESPTHPSTTLAHSLTHSLAHARTLESRRYPRQLEKLLDQSKMYSLFLVEQMNMAEQIAVSAAEGQARKKRKAANGKSTVKSLGDAGDELSIKETTDELCPGFEGLLRDYQLKGVQWLISLYQNGVNGILADQMGLGKTIQTIAFLCHMRAKGVFGPFLILGPLSTLPNWVSEFERWAPQFSAVLYHGSKQERAAIRSRTRLCDKQHGVDETFPVFVTSYEIAIADIKFLQKLEWKYIVVDEGHRYDCLLACLFACLYRRGRGRGLRDGAEGDPPSRRPPPPHPPPHPTRFHHNPTHSVITAREYQVEEHGLQADSSAEDAHDAKQAAADGHAAPEQPGRAVVAAQLPATGYLQLAAGL